MSKRYIHTTIYLRPGLYKDSKVLHNTSECYDTAILNGSYLEYEDLENPIRESIEDLIDDYRQCIADLGIKLTGNRTCFNRRKFELCWTIDCPATLRIVITVKVTKNPFKLSLPINSKKAVCSYLDMRKILDNSAFDQGIDFLIDHVVVNKYRTKCFCSSLDRFLNMLRKEISR